MSAADIGNQAWVKSNEMQFFQPFAEPIFDLRAKTQLVINGILRYMGEEFQLPAREALGLVGEGEAEQIIERIPLYWAQNAPGPREGPGNNYLPGSLGSREKHADAGQQLARQVEGENRSTYMQPQMYNDYRDASTAGTKGPTWQWWQVGALQASGGVTGASASVTPHQQGSGGGGGGGTLRQPGGGRPGMQPGGPIMGPPGRLLQQKQQRQQQGGKQRMTPQQQQSGQQQQPWSQHAQSGQTQWQPGGQQQPGQQPGQQGGWQQQQQPQPGAGGWQGQSGQGQQAIQQTIQQLSQQIQQLTQQVQQLAQHIQQQQSGGAAQQQR